MTEKDCMNAVHKLREDMDSTIARLEAKYSERIKHLEEQVSYLETEISVARFGKEFA